MVNMDQLMEKISANGFTKEKMAKKIGMETEIFNQKLKGSENCFTIKEANKLVELLKLEGKEAGEIFFG
ncbi:MAG: XRE family transcriptional regulator [Anaerotignum sp.]|nr:XRE family transcriptional regulator [Anaerotignum sp.]